MNKQKLPYGKILSVDQIGATVRYRRKLLNATQSKTAGLSGVGQRFLSELERGKPTAETGKVLKVLQRLGLEMIIVPRGWSSAGEER
jgi:HTH-type transcriptional regulator / antitoxin HipB